MMNGILVLIAAAFAVAALVALRSSKVDVSNGSTTSLLKGGGKRRQLQACATFDTTKSYHIIARHSAKSLTIANHTELPSRIVQRTLDQLTDYDDWSFTATGNGRYEITNDHSGNAMNVQFDSLVRGGNIIQWPAGPASNDNWCLEEVEDGIYSIQSEHSGYFLDVERNSRADDAGIVQWDYQGKANQQFSVVPVFNPGNCAVIDTEKDYHIIARHSDMNLHVLETGNELSSRFVFQANVDPMFPDDDWRMVDVNGTGYYNILNGRSGRGLNVMRNRLDPGTPIIQWSITEGELNAHWCFVDLMNGYYSLIAQHSGMALDVDKRSTTEGAGLIQWPATFAFNQQFRLKVAPKCIQMPTDQIFHIQARHSSKALHVPGGFASTVVRPVLQMSLSNNPADNWRLVETFSETDAMFLTDVSDTDGGDPNAIAVTIPDGGGNNTNLTVANLEFVNKWRTERPRYHIVNVQTGRIMRVSGQSNDTGAVIELWSGDAFSTNDNWCFTKVSEAHYTIIAEHSGKVISVDQGFLDDGAAIVQSDYDDEEASQQFMLTPVFNETMPDPVGTVCVEMATNKTYHITARHSGKALNVLGESTANEQIGQESIGYSTFDNWILEESGAGYKIISEYSQRPLTIDGMSVVQGGTSSSTDWCFLNVGNGYYQISPVDGPYVMNVYNASVAEGAEILMDINTGFSHQQFMLTDASKRMGAAFYPGRWDGPYATPLIAAAGANLPDGKLVLWSSYSRSIYGHNDGRENNGRTYTLIYDPVANNYTEALIRNTHHDMFCPGTAILPDTRIMITGGSRSDRTTFYDPRNDTWIEGPRMHINRGYHSMTSLSDGSVFSFGGSWTGGLVDKDGELWDYNNNSWTLKPDIKSNGTFLTNDVEGVYRADNHYWMFEAPNGLVFHAGPSVNMHWIDVKGDGQIWDAGLRNNSIDSMTGNAIMYDIGKILTLGGARFYAGGAANRGAYVIDVSDPNLDPNVDPIVNVTRTGDMNFPRAYSSSVVLPTGQVIVLGGGTTSTLFTDDSAVLVAEMWDPEEGEFLYLSSMVVPRTYHSIGLLMKDGRILVAGGGLCGNCMGNHPDTEIFTPPYLLHSDTEGTPKIRPVIVSAPTNVTHGETITIEMDTPTNHTFALVRLSAVTHATNNDLRRIPLGAIPLVGAEEFFEISIPFNPSVALPGSYFLFAMNDDGVPSVAETVSIHPVES